MKYLAFSTLSILIGILSFSWLELSLFSCSIVALIIFFILITKKPDYFKDDNEFDDFYD